jgi:Flp pilus assembly protein CpaB
MLPAPRSHQSFLSPELQRERFVKRSNRLVILVGVLLAVLAFVGIVVVLNGQGGSNPNNGQPVTAKVLVAKADIAIGDPVTPDKVETKDVDPTAAGSDALHDPSQVGGQPALTNVAAGSQVTKSTIGLNNNALIDVSASLKAGERAVGFQVDRVTGLDFLVQPGDYIDVVLQQKINVLQPTVDSAADPNAPPRFETIPGLESARTVKTVLQNKRVLYVSAQRTAQPAPVEGQAQPSQAPAAIENVIIVFAGTDQDAEVLKFVQNNVGEIGDLTAVVRSGEDSAAKDATTTGITIDLLVKDFGVPIPDIVQSLNKTTP